MLQLIDKKMGELGQENSCNLHSLVFKEPASAYVQLNQLQTSLL